MERDLTDFDPNYIFDRDEFFLMVKKVMSLDYFNRIKQFMIRLFRNNLFLGNKYNSMQKGAIVNCFVCGNHPEKHKEVMFLFKNYPINSIDNISLMFTWKHIYNFKYGNDSLLCIPYAFAFKSLIAIITHMSLPLTLTARDILKILDFELKVGK